jgi:glycoprotein endo-alpha-1,2-mannosidase
VAAGVFIALMLTLSDGPDIIAGGFDGCYTYFASDQVSWAAQPDNWPKIARCVCLMLCSAQG